MSVFDLCWINLGISIYSSNKIDFDVNVWGMPYTFWRLFHFRDEFLLILCNFIPLLRAKMNLTCTYVFSESIK